MNSGKFWKVFCLIKFVKRWQKSECQKKWKARKDRKNLMIKLKIMMNLAIGK